MLGRRRRRPLRAVFTGCAVITPLTGRSDPTGVGRQTRVKVTPTSERRALGYDGPTAAEYTATGGRHTLGS
jgi:hypothetical protein